MFVFIYLIQRNRLYLPLCMDFAITVVNNLIFPEYFFVFF